jgi:hypothetical protein
MKKNWHEKKKSQLGIDPATASGRLVKDLLFKLAIDAGHRCYRCGEELTRDTFSIEHKERWLDSPDPVRFFFDLNNIGFSHKSCNREAARTIPRSAPHGSLRRYKFQGCRCEPCTETAKIKMREQRWRRKHRGYALTSGSGSEPPKL